MATIKIKQIKSKIGYPVGPVIRGMIRKVHHLVEVID